jgi:hypothetical protein
LFASDVETGESKAASRADEFGLLEPVASRRVT